jgi:hypothetical protein
MIQEFLRKYFAKPFDAFVDWAAKISWKQKHPITPVDKENLARLMTKDYYIIATRRGNYLTTYFIGIANFFLSGKFGFYSHVLMNLEDEVKGHEDFKFVEALGSGTQYSTWTEVFGDYTGDNSPDAVALIKPKCLSVEDWTLVLDGARAQVGKPYDTLFDLKDDQAISCVEMVRLALQRLPDYEKNFANFEKLIAKRKNLTPQMFLECKDFEIYYEIRR